MKDKANSSLENILRQKAEEYLNKKSINTDKHYTDMEIFKLVHELKQYQAELETQNKELLSAKIKAETDAQKYANLYDLAPSGYFTLSKKGEILKLNFSGASLLGKERSELLHKPFALFLADESKTAFNSFLEELFERKTKQTCELVLSTQSNIPTYAILSGIFSPETDQCVITMHDISQLKKAEKTLEKSELLLNSTLESHVDIFIFSIDKDYNYLSYNKAHSDIMKHSFNVDIKVGMNNLDCIASIEIRKIAKENYDRAFAGETHSSIKTYGDIDKTHYESIFNPIVDANHQIIGITCLARNITKRIQNQETIRINEEKYRTLFESNRDSITIFRLDKEGNPGNFIDVNPATKSIFGYTKKDLLAMSIADLMIVSERKREFLKAILHTDGKVNFETVIKNKRGEYRYVEIETIVINYLNEPAIMIIARDISERKQNEKNTKKAQENLTTILQAIPDLLFEVDLQGRIHYYQGSRNDLLLLPENEFIDKNFTEIIPIESATICFEAMHEALDKGWSTGKEYWIDLPQGKSWFELSVSPINETGKMSPHFIMLSRDITIRKEAEEKLRAEKERIRTILELIGTPIFLKDNEHRVTFANTAFCTLLNLEEKSIIGKTLAENVPENEQEHFLKVDRKVLDTGDKDIREETLTVKGKEHTVITSKTRFIDAAGNKSLVCAIYDISERKIAQDALQKSEKKLQGIFNVANSGIVLIDNSGNFSLFNDWSCKLLGYTRNEFQELNATEITHPDDLEKSRTLNKDLLEGKIDTYQIEKRYLKKDKSFVWCEISASAIKDENDNVINIIGIVNDITERIKGKEALEKSQEKLRGVFELANSGIVLTDLKGKYLLFNNWCTEALGYTRAELNKLTRDDLTPPDDIENSNINFNKLIEGKIDRYQIEKRYLRKDKSCFWAEVSVSAIKDKNNKVVNTIGIINDITEKRNIKNALLESEARLIEAQELAKVGHWEFDLDFTNVLWSKESFKIFGFEPDAGPPSEQDFFSVFHPEDRNMVKTNFENSINSNLLNCFEYKITTPAGVEKTIEERWKILRNEQGQPLRAVGTYQDITARKKIEESLNESKRFALATLDALSAHIAILDENGYILAVNDAWRHFMAANANPSHSSNLIEGQNYLSVCENSKGSGAAEGLAMAAGIYAVMNGEQDEFSLEYPCHSPTEKRWFNARVTRFSGKGDLRIVVAHENITQRKLSEELIEQSKTRFSSIINSSRVAMALNDENLNVTYLNRAFVEMFGYTIQDIPTVQDWFLKAYPDPEYRKKTIEIWNSELEKTNQTQTEFNPIEITVRCKNGTDKIVLVSANPLMHSFGREYVINLYDITDRKIAEKAKEDTQNLIQNIASRVPGVVYQYLLRPDGSSCFPYASDGIKQIYDVSPNEVVEDATKIFEKIHSDDYPAVMASIQESAKNMTPWKHEYRAKFDDGTIRYLYGNAKPQKLEDQSVLWHGYITDITEKKVVENSLRESEEKYRGLVENSPDGVVIYIDDKIAFINSEGCRMLGAKSKEEIIGKPVLQFIHPDSLEDVSKRMKEVVLDDYVSTSVEERFVDLNGNPFYVEIKGIPTVYERKNAVQIIVHDISLRKQISSELNKINRVYALISQINNLIIRTQSQEELFQEICNIAVDFGKFRMSWIGLINDDQKIITAAYAGYEKGYFTKNNLTTLVDVPEGRGPTGTAVREGRTVICNDVTKDKMMKPWRKDALERGYYSLISIPISVRSKIIGAFNLYSEESNFFSSEEEISLLEKIILNISFALEKIQIEEDRKKTEDKIRQLSQAVEQSPVTIVITNTKGEIEYANPKFVETTGYTLEEVVNQNPRVLKSGYTSTDEYNNLWQTIAAGNEWHGEFHNKRKDGSLFWESATISPIVNDEGKTTHFIAIKEDITHRKNVEKELIKSKERAEESDRLKLAFLANMSHEIRTPMNGILGFTELLKEPKLSGEEQQEYIDIIEKSGKRMLNIINDIISISKVESGQIEVSLTETNINEQIDYIHTFFKPEAKQKGIELFVSKQLASKDTFIKTDREKVYAVLTNLVKNALKFTNEGSIEFGCEKKENNLEFFIKDTGLGISKSQKKIIFERFRQANETISRPHEGSGLGLAISKAYVEILGGKIWVESKHGKGSTFHFTIPLNSENKTEEKNFIEKSVSVVKDGNTIKNLKVLIVEDDAISKLLITIAVKPYSKEILKVSTGIEAVEACRNNPDIDLVMMDINMPKMGGYEATKLIREFNKDLIIIAQTANGMQSDRDNAIASGCNDYISKPINIISLSKLIHTYFNK